MLRVGPLSMFGNGNLSQREEPSGRTSRAPPLVAPTPQKLPKFLPSPAPIDYSARNNPFFRHFF